MNDYGLYKINRKIYGFARPTILVKKKTCVILLALFVLIAVTVFAVMFQTY